MDNGSLADDAEGSGEFYPQTGGYRLTRHESPLSYFWCEADRIGEAKIVASGVDIEEAVRRVKNIIDTRIALGS